jgi:5'-methylthioadenosine phosphorylase
MKPLLGVFGGSGFYSLAGASLKKKFRTQWGEPSAPVQFAKINGVPLAFLPRHGEKHSIPPHKINYRANVTALKQAGATQIFGPFACGSLQPGVRPGDFVVADQFVDRTAGRADTFFEGPDVVHIGGAEPYCPRLRATCLTAAKEAGLRVHEKGTAVVVNGPRFSTKAESKWFSRQGWEVITMTQYPEVVLAREAGLCYAGVGLVTDYDAGLEGHPDVPAVTARDVVKVFKENNAKLAKLLESLVKQPALQNRGCNCAKAVEEGRIH